jgi:hypothetical protein
MDREIGVFALADFAGAHLVFRIIVLAVQRTERAPAVLTHSEARPAATGKDSTVPTCFGHPLRVLRGHSSGWRS